MIATRSMPFGLDEVGEPGVMQGKATAETAVTISLVVPTRNEAENVDPLLRRLQAATADLDVEILFVDDSDDETPETIRTAQAHFPLPIRLLARPPQARNGLSGAVVAGLRAARGEWVCVMDADLQHPPETLPLLWRQAQKSGADMVVGSRKGDVIGPLGLSRGRSLTSKGLTILARMLFPRVLKNVSDPLTGLFLVRRASVDVAALRPDGFKILLEILVRCPALYVSEVHFDFAPRHSGQSKADFQEGVRFLRHLLTLRVTVNLHLVRFVLLLLSDLAGHVLLVYALVAGLGLNYLWAAVVATEVVMLWHFGWAETWVFSERSGNGRRRRFLGDFLLTQLGLLIHLPLMNWLVAGGWLSILPANLMALLVVSVVRYGLSEQWIWTRGSMVWQRQNHWYDLHGIGIASHVPFVELETFATATPPAQIDIQIRLDRQGTPTQLPEGISYDEQMGRFGFSLTVRPGTYTEVVVSPLLQRSPAFLFTNVVEPVLRWWVVEKGFALVKAACVAADGRALLLVADSEMGQAVAALCGQAGHAFLADDRVLVDGAGRAYSYPKPVTVDPSMVRGNGNGRFSLGDRWALVGQRLLYSHAVRRLGLWLSERNLPAATLNTYIQWLIPQPKHRLEEIVPGVKVATSAPLQSVVWVSDGESLSRPQITRWLQQRQEEASGFQPYPLLLARLSRWQDRDWRAEEAAIIESALRRCALRQLPAAGDVPWWQALDEAIPAALRMAPLTQSGKPRTS